MPIIQTNLLAIAATDQQLRELRTHGSEHFPCACYRSSVDRNVTDVTTPHWHDHLEFVLVERGKLSFLANSEEYMLSEGEGLFINKHTLHCTNSIHSEGAIVQTTVFHTNLFGEQSPALQHLDRIIGNDRYPIKKLTRANVLEARILQDLVDSFDAFDRADDGYEFLVYRALSDICYALVKLYPLDGEQAETAAEQLSLPLRRMIDHMRAHYSEPLTPQDIANAAGLSLTDCQRSFRTELNTTCAHFLTQLRTEVAAQRILESDAELRDICRETGFPSASYFSKAFKQQYDCSPSEYREQCKRDSSRIH